MCGKKDFAFTHKYMVRTTYLEGGRRGHPSERATAALEVGAHLSTKRVVGFDLRRGRREQARDKYRYPRVKDSTGSNDMGKELDIHVHTCSYTTKAASTNLSPIHLKIKSHFKVK